MKKIYCIAVTFNPEIESFKNFISKIKHQVQKTIIIDNNSKNFKDLINNISQSENIIIIKNIENYGIAHAQNQGIQISIEESASHCIFFDQDSDISNNFVESLILEEQRILSNNIKLAAIGPRILDENSGNTIPIINYKNGLKQRIFLSSTPETVECFSLLSSGTLINIKALKDVGFYKSELFIEYVDVEWGARAKNLGYSLFATSKAVLVHNLGEQRITFLSFTIPLHSPLRHYYTMRNAIFMQKQNYIPKYWKVNDFLRTTRNFIFFSLFNKPRKKQMEFMIKGIFDGINGSMGKIKNEK